MKPHSLCIGILAGALLPLGVQADDKLAVAAMYRDLDSVRQLLSERGADVNALGPNATPALHWLVRIEALELTKRLLDAGADVNLRNGLGLAALSLAIENRDLDMVQLLLDAGADVKTPDVAGESPLMQAARSGSPGIVQAVLKRGVDIDYREPHDQQTALMIGVRSGSTEVVALLLAAGADVNAQSLPGEEPKWRLPENVAASHGVGVNWGGYPARGQREAIGGAKTPLLYATRQGDLDTTKLLLAAGADIEQSDANGDTPLLNAIINAAVEAKPGLSTQHLDVARYLIGQGANINASDWYGQTPLYAAVDLRNVEVRGPISDNGIDRAAVLDLIKELLARGADPNSSIKEVLPVRRWITRLGNLQWVDVTGQTVFHRAALSGDVTTMKLLVEHGADANIKSSNGTTPLMAAAGINWTVAQTFDEGPEALLEAVKLAHALGNDVNDQNELGLAAIHGAANRGLNDIISWLAANGARLDIADKVGRTPVVWAHGVFLATHPPVDRPETVALIESLLAQQANTRNASNP
ncbi:MAG: ankyrin repeat domain-containing protein [Pseudomonadales bacterium]|nr:ankyrin repeat domain-containing protein [Pseudomonadales bacterium]